MSELSPSQVGTTKISPDTATGPLGRDRNDPCWKLLIQFFTVIVWLRMFLSNNLVFPSIWSSIKDVSRFILLKEWRVSFGCTRSWCSALSSALGEGGVHYFQSNFLGRSSSFLTPPLRAWTVVLRAARTTLRQLLGLSRSCGMDLWAYLNGMLLPKELKLSWMRWWKPLPGAASPS